MYVSAEMLAAEAGISKATVIRHVKKLEAGGLQIRKAAGRPRQINREMFLRYLYGPQWGGRNEEGI